MRLSTIAVCVLFATLSPSGLHAQPFYDYDSDITNANAKVGVAQGEVNAAQSQLERIGTGIRSLFEASDPFVKAKRELTDAQKQNEANRKKVLEQLHATADYQTASAAHEQAATDVTDARAKGDTPGDVMMTLATVAMKAGQVLTQMDAKALNDDKDFQASRKRLAEAQNASTDLEQGYKTTLLTNPDWQHARADLDKAHADLTAANAAASAAINARNDWLNHRSAERVGHY